MSVDSQLPSDQTNSHGRGGYFGVADTDLMSNFSFLTSVRKLVYNGSCLPT